MRRPEKLHCGGYVKRSLVIGLTFLALAAPAAVSIYNRRLPAADGNVVGRPPSGSRLSGQKVTCLTNPAHAKAFELLAQWFHEETGAAVQNIVVPVDEMLSHPERDIRSRRPSIDVLMIRYQHLGILHEKRMLTDLSRLIEDHEETLRTFDFIHTLYEAYTLYGGRRWALPFDGDIHLLFYRKSLLEKYRLSPPQTWTDFLHVSGTITENERVNGIYGSAIMMHPFFMYSISSYMNRLASHGGSLFDADGKPTVDTAEGLAALTDLVAQCRFALPTPQETDWNISRDAFLTGKVAMVEQWSDLGIMAEDLSQSLIGKDWGVVPLPIGNGPGARHAAPLNAGYGLAISSKAPNREAAKAYVLFASRPDIALRLCLANVGVDPTRFSILYSKQYQEFAPQVSQVLRGAMKEPVAWTRIPETTELLSVLSGKLTDAVEGRKRPEEALAEAQELWREILDRH